MAQQNESGQKAFLISEDMVAYRAVKFATTAETVSYAGAGERIAGILQRDADDSDDDRPSVHLRSRPGTFKVMVAAACSVGDLLYAAASGKLSSTVVGTPQMVALEAATADGDIIEAAFVEGPVLTGTARTAFAHATTGDTLTTAQSGSIHTNTGASGTVVINLPAATVGLEYFFRVSVAQAIQIEPATGETISLPSTGVPEAANDYISADAIGETVHLMCCVAGSWSVFGWTGTWTGQ